MSRLHRGRVEISRGMEDQNRLPCRIWFCCVLASLFVSGLIPAIGGELLVNGDFEIGTPPRQAPASSAPDAPSSFRRS